MPEHKYEKDGGLVYPVHFGETWRCGEATIRCDDFQRLDPETGPSEIDLVYVDPPWGAALARGYRTKAGIDGERGAAVNFPLFLELLAGLCTESGAPVFVEMGKRDAQKVVDAFRLYHYDLMAEWSITYYRKNPACLMEFESSGSPVRPELWSLNLNGMDDEQTPSAVIEAMAHPRGLVFDPCTGRGLTAVSALKAGRWFYGIELNPYRVSVTLRKLRDLTGEQPRKVSNG